MKKPTLKQQKTLNKVREVMQDYPTGIPFNELMQKCLLSAVATQHALGVLGASESFDGLWRLPHRNSSVEQPVMRESAESLQETAEMMQESDQQSSTSQAIETAPVAESSEIDEQNTEVGQAKSLLDEAKDAPYEKLIMPKKPRNKPFTPNPIMGYQVQKGKAKIFLDRRATSKTLTLSLDDLKELVNAVEKSERVA